jgi:branched-chain amino acid transport system ATP-binding protein
LARALACAPKLLLLDEPFSGLDTNESSQLGDLLEQLAGDGLAILLVEHDMEMVMRLCQTIHVLNFGSVIASGRPAEIKENAEVQAAYLGAPIAAAGAGA